MILYVCSIHDGKAQAFITPFVVRQPDMAVRWFGSEIANPSTDFSKFAEDYTLFELGTFNDETGDYVLHDSPRALIRGAVLKAAILKERE